MGEIEIFRRWRICFTFFSGYSHSNSTFQDPFSIHHPYFTYSVFSPFSDSHVTTCCPCFSVYHLSRHNLFFLFYSYCLQPISQIGSRGPVSQHLTWECPGRDPSWRQSGVRAVDRDSIPASDQCFLDASSPWGCRRSPGRELFCASCKCCLDLGISDPCAMNADSDTVPNILS